MSLSTMKLRRCRRRSLHSLFIIVWITAQCLVLSHGCQFYPLGEYLRFVRIPENLRVGERVMNVEIHNRKNLTLESVDKSNDANYFTLSEISPHMIDIRLRKSLDNIVDNEMPQNILKFRLVCIPDEPETTPSFLSITVYVEDVNDNRPQFLNLPYHVTVEELTPIGLTVFRGIQAIDLDKPNTANSDIHFSIVEGNDDGKFSLESSHRAALVVKKNLDYDSGDHEFRLKIMASDRGNPSMSSTTILTVKVLDSDDLPPIFTQQVYRTQIKEFWPFSNRSIHQEIVFPSPILAYDQDLGINASIQYDIVSGNELNYFEIDSKNGSLYLIREVDRAALASNIFDLQIRSKQIDDPSKFGLSKVEIEIIDLNNNLPQFEVDVYNISIMENLPNGFSVVQVLARDVLDQGENSDFVYKLEDRSRAFAIDPKTGWLTVRDQSQLDRERVSSIKLKVYADEKLPNIAYGGTRSQALVEIMLLDSNDNNPTFVPSNLYKFQVTIDSEIGSVVGQVVAQDADLDLNGKVIYELQKSNTSTEDVPFEIDAKNGYIFLLERPLPKLQYTLLVEAADQPINPSERRYSLAVVQIDVVKAGSNHSPEFIGSPYEFWVGTHVGIGTSVGQVKVKELDPKFTVYDLLHSYYEGVPFAIEERTGIIAVVDELIKYPRSHYDFEAYVTDSRHTLTTNLTIHVVDPIDSVTESSREPIELNVKENVGGAIIANLRTLLDVSGELKSPMEFLLANYDARDKFAIAGDGTVYTLKGLDREEKAKHLLTVISQNRGVIQGQGVYQIFVNVEDVNDNPPKFERPNYEARVRENSNPGTPLIMEYPVKVIDPDDGPNADFTIELRGDGADRFRVDPKNGKLYVGNVPLDREEKQLYTLKLVATDVQGNMSSSAGLSIRVDDINDNSPVIFDKIIILDPPDLDVSTGQRELLRSSASQPVSIEISNTEPIKIPETTAVGNKIARVMASDRDVGDNSKINYRIVSENSNPIGGKFSFLTDKQYLFSRNKDKHFMIDRTSGEISVAKTLKPDQEYALNISATDRGGLRSYTGIRVIVEDINNMVPRFEQPWYSFELLEGNYLRGEIGSVQAQDGDMGKNGEVVYRIQTKDDAEPLPDKFPFNIDAKSGLIYVNGDIDREQQSRYSFQVASTDLGYPPLESVVDVDIAIIDRNDESPKFYGFMSSIKSPKDGKMLPIYRASIRDDAPPMTTVITVRANDSDYIGNGNGLVLFHLKDHHKEFYIDSKNGTISTLTNLDFERQNGYNITVVASDLGKPSLSSSALVFIRLVDSADPERKGEIKERMFNQEVFSFQLPFSKAAHSKFPAALGKMNVNEKFRKFQTEYELFGEESVTSKFRMDPRTGELVLLDKLQENRTYEFVVRAFNPRVTRGFDIRQGNKMADRFLEHNEALVRVEVLPAPPPLLPPVTLPPTTRRTTTVRPSTTLPTTTTKRIITSTTTTARTTSSSEPAIVTKGPYSPIQPSRVYPSSPEFPNVLDTGKKAPQKNSNLYAGEIAVLTLSCVIFLGGLVAAISIACVRKRRRRLSRRRSHLPAIPVEVRLQKQMPSRSIANAPNRTVIFPMALPPEPLHTESSDNTSDTYTDTQEVLSGGGGGGMNHHRSSKRFGMQSGLPVCPDCHKIRKPNINNHHGERAIRRSHRNLDRGPMKSSVIRPREFSLPSSNDSGIDGSDGHCTCCQSHNNSSSESGRDFRRSSYASCRLHEREQYEDSLMPNLHHRPKSFKRKRTNQQGMFSSSMHPASGPSLSQQLSSHINRRADRIVIL